MITTTNTLEHIDLFKKVTNMINPDIASSDFVFFDIETTGLEACSSAVYLIGYMCIDGDKLVLTQLFGESFNDQNVLVEEFQKVINSHKCIIHFNGQTFDIPYLEKKGNDFSNIISYDLYRQLKSYKNFFGLNSMKQKKLEQYVGLDREDKYDGGTLIDFYLKYLATSKITDLQKSCNLTTSIQNKNIGFMFRHIEESGLSYLNNTDKNYLLDTLLLHNYEDVEGMLEVAKLISIFPENLYKLLEVSNFDTCFSCTKDSSDYIAVEMKLNDTDFISLFNIIFKQYSSTAGKLTSSQILLKDIINFSYANGSFNVSMNKYSGILKQFFNNYKDYCYLPAEDKVIPKELAKFMDKSLYQKATADNCYISYEGSFIPVAINKNPDINKHFFKESYNASIIYLTEKEFFSLSPDELIKLLINLFLN